MTANGGKGEDAQVERHPSTTSITSELVLVREIVESRLSGSNTEMGAQATEAMAAVEVEAGRMQRDPRSEKQREPERIGNVERESTSFSTDVGVEAGAYAVGGMSDRAQETSETYGSSEPEEEEKTEEEEEVNLGHLAERQDVTVFGDQRSTVPSTTLVTAAEVFEETSAEFRRKEALMEEQIRQRLMQQSVEANVIQLDLEEQSPPKEHMLAASCRPQLFVALALLFLLLAGAVGVALVIRLTTNDDRSDEQSPPLVTPEPKDNLEPEEEAIGINWPPDDAIIAQVPDTICYERMPLFGVSRMCINATLEMGSGVTNLVAESRLANFPDVDISIVNAAEVIADIGPGNFTVSDAKALFPYDNMLVILQVEGSKVITALERGLQKIVDDYALIEDGRVSGGSYPYGAGIRYWVNMSENFPNRLSNVEVNPQLLAGDTNWIPINETEIYSVVTNAFIAGGGDGYNEFLRLPEERKSETNIDAVSAFIEFCQDEGVLQEPPLSHFSTQHYINNKYNWTWEWD